jgi:hypothetical protein
MNVSVYECEYVFNLKPITYNLQPTTVFATLNPNPLSDLQTISYQWFKISFVFSPDFRGK